MSVEQVKVEGLSARSQQLLKEREADIAAFVLKKMDQTSRTAFVRELEADQALRIAAGIFRLNCDADVEVSETAFQLLENAIDGIRQGNPLFPGDSYILGMENRPDIAPQRECSYRRTIAAAEKLVSLGELEDAALENAHRARVNIENGKAAQKQFRSSTDASAFMGAMTASFGEEFPLVTGRYEPYYLPSRDRSLPLESILHVETLGLRERKTIAMNLFQLFPTERDQGYYSYWNVLKDGSKPELEAKLLEHMERSPELRGELRNFLAAPLVTPKPHQEVASKVMAAKFLLKGYERSQDPTDIESVRKKIENIFESRDLLGNEKLPDTSCLLVRCLLRVLVSAGNTNHDVWKPAREMLFDQFRKSKFGLLPPKSMESENGEVLETLEHAPLRLKGDPETVERISALSIHSNPVAKSTATRLLVNLPLETAVPLLARNMALERNYKSKSLVYDLKVRDTAARGLEEVTRRQPGPVKTFNLEQQDLAKEFPKVKNIAELAQQVFVRTLKTPRGKEWDDGFLVALVSIQKLLEDPRWRVNLSTLMHKGPINQYALHAIVRFVDEEKITDAAEDLIKMIAYRELSDRDAEYLVEHLEETGVARKDIGNKLIGYWVKDGRCTREINQAMLLTLRKTSAPFSPEIHRAAMTSQDRYVLVQAMRSLENHEIQPRLTAADISPVLELLRQSEALHMGFLCKDSSLAEEAAGVIAKLGRGPAKDAVAAAIKTKLGELKLKDGSTIKDSGFAELLWKQYESLGAPTKSGPMSGYEALFYLITAVGPNQSILETFIESFSSHDGRDLSLEEQMSRRYVARLLGDDYQELESWMAEAQLDSTQITAMCSMTKVRADQDAAAVVKPEQIQKRLFRKLSVSARGLSDTQMPNSSDVFKQLHQDFLDAYRRIDWKKLDPEIEEANVAFIAAVLLRTRADKEALSFLQRLKRQMESKDILDIATCGIVGALEAKKEGKALVAKRVLSNSKLIAEKLPASERQQFIEEMGRLIGNSI